VTHWFCIRSQPKHEHIAAAHLQAEGVEVYLPRIRFRRSTRRGPVWFTEALFPAYLFARFDLARQLRAVRHARGVSTVVHFGERWPEVPGDAISALQACVSADGLHVIPDDPTPGDPVVVSGGSFHGLQGLVRRLIPSRQRVEVLLEFLGRQTSVELPREALVMDVPERQRLL
jgi:transcriptional antiterminator RfaH